MSATTIVPAPPLNSGPSEIIAWQKECLRLESYTLLGRVWMIVLEAAAGAHVPAPTVAQVLGSRIEFYNERGGPDVAGPRIAQTGPRGALLLLDPLVREDGYVGLPDIPDPTWKPPIPKASEIAYQPPKRPKNAGKNWKPPAAPNYAAPKAPMIPQRLVDQKDGYGGRARGQIKDNAQRRYLVCGPLQQIIVRPMDDQSRILPNGLIFKCLPSTPIPGTTSTVMDLLIDAETGESFFYGGRFEIVNVG